MDARGYSENTDPRPNQSINMDPSRSHERSNMTLNDGEDDKEERHRHHHRRHHPHHHKRHYHRMRMHDHNVRKLIDNDLEVSQPCICDTMATPSTALEAFGAWGTMSQTSKVIPPKTKKTNHKRTTAGSGKFSAGSYKSSSFGRDRDAVNDEDSYRFQHYEDISLYIKQYREENTICIQGGDPCGPPVLGKDTPDPYFAKLSQCGDLWDRLMAFTALAREQMYDSDNSRDSSPFLRVLHPGEGAHSAPPLPLSADLQMRSHATRKAINLAPVRDCRVAVKTINFPNAAPPKRQPNHIPQLQQQAGGQQTLNLPDIQPTRIALPLPVRIVVNSESLKGNKLTTLSPPPTPVKPGPPLVRSESVDRLHAQYRMSKQALAKKRSEGDIRYPICSTATATDFTFADPNIYQQFLAQQRKLSKQSSGENSSKNSKKDTGRPQPPISIVERYSSSSLVTAVNKGY